MFKEFTENTITKAKEDIVISQGMIVLIAAVSFITGLIIGIICASGSVKKKSKSKKRKCFDADEYPVSLISTILMILTTTVRITSTLSDFE